MTEEEFLDSLLDRLAEEPLDAWQIELTMQLAQKFYQLLEKHGYKISYSDPKTITIIYPKRLV